MKRIIDNISVEDICVLIIFITLILIGVHLFS